MRRLKHAFAVTLQIAAVFGFEVAGCSSDNGPSAPGAGGATTGSGGTGGATTGSGGTGGATTGSGGSGGATTGSGGSGGATTGAGGSGGATTGSGGSGGTTTGSGGSAGTTTGSGGSAGTTTGSGGSAGASKDGGGTGGATTGSGGSAGASADSGTGGAGGVADASSGKDSSGDAGGGFSPLCSNVPLTMAGEVPTKGGVCTPTDAQLCYKTCGPLSIGFKSETCTGGVYVEQSDCSFPDGDYACYKIPAAISATCPTTTPKASQPCSVAECTLCNVAGSYLDSADAMKPGYCVCPPGPDSGTARKWSCASTTAWPCPAGKGCQ